MPFLISLYHDRVEICTIGTLFPYRKQFTNPRHLLDTAKARNSENAHDLRGGWTMFVEPRSHSVFHDIKPIQDRRKRRTTWLLTG